MITVYVNEKNEVKDVGTTTDKSLTALEITDEDSPLIGWSVAKICCHKVWVKNGRVAKFTPYVDTKIIEHIDRLSKEVSTVSNDVLDAQAQLDYIAMMTDVEM